MRKFFVSIAVVAQLLFLSSCAAAWQGVTYADDLYAIHNKTAIAERQKAEAELAKAQYEAQQAQYEATLAQIKAEATKQGFTVTEDAVVNGYDAVLADSYESAYARRLYGFSSPTYRMPSSYYTWRYSDAFQYASAYDPAFYNVMVSGDMVWVEPKYITSMFGSWGAVAVPSYGWYYGWNDPFYYWNRPYRYSWNRYWGWGHPYYYHHYHSHHHHHHRPHRPPHHNHPPHHGGVGNTGVHHNRPGMVVGRNPGASRPADRGGSVRPSQPSSGRVSQPAYRSSGSSSSRYNSGSSSYRSSSGSSSYRSSGSSSSSRGSSFGGGGSSHSSGGGSYSGGGNSRGR
ncbi:MAG: hypothetical protein J6V21_06145 [Alistipes sp.]|nr:hypothetical protein [Alistipes sp.]